MAATEPPNHEEIFDPEDVFEVLDRHRVDYVLIGGVAATLHGSPHATWDTDICPSTDRANVERLASALLELDARVYTTAVPDGLPFDVSAEALLRAGIWNLVTRAGRLDISFRPTASTGYDDLRERAVTVELRSATVAVASLEDIVRSKTAAGREKDEVSLPTLRRLLERIEDETP